MNLKNLAARAALTVAMAGSGMAAHAVIAYPGTITHTNPDGTTVEIRRHGDENFNFTATADGYLITCGTDGYYRYATVDNGKAVATDILATDADMRTADVNSMLMALDAKSMATRLVQSNEAMINGPMKSASDPTAETTTTFPTTGSPRVLVILVQYPDYPFNYSKQQFQNWLSQEGYNYNNGTGAASGSVLDYYKASSNGMFTPQFDVYGPYTASNERAYYGETQNSSKTRVTELVREACTYLHNNTDINFANYDCNNDGSVDNVYMIFAGPGCADSNDDDAIWPHKWYLRGGGNSIIIDSKRIDQYGCSPELSSGRYFTAIGTFCHEFGHVLGLGDHYDTAYCGNRDPDSWDIMASGSYNNNAQTPPLFSAYERAVMGWVKPQQLTERGNYTLRAASRDGYDDTYIIPTTKTNEYFVLENRQKTGWDSYLPHHGMLIWHIDYNSSIWASNKINCTSHQYVDIEEAGGVTNGNEQATPFPGITNNRTFADDTNPSMKMWSGANTNAPLTAITETSDGVISFQFKGGEAVPSRLELLEPVTAYNQATISWKPLDGINEYIVTVTNAATGNVIANEVTVQATSYTLNSLDARTTYDYTVAYYENYSWAETSSSFTTDITPLNMRRPENIVTTEIGSNYFITEWDEVEQAERYSVTVYTGTVGGATVVTESFDNATLLDGWGSESNNFISTTGYYGSAAPSLRLDGAQSIQSDLYKANITQVQVMNRRIGNTSGSITVYGRSSQSDNWAELGNRTVGNSKARFTVPVDAAQQIHQIKIAQTVEDASIMVDDIALSLDSSIELTALDGFTAMDAGTTPTHTVKGLDSETTYYYTVRAHNSTYDSFESTPVEVTTDASSGIDNIVNDSNTSTVSIDGTVLTVTTATEATVTIYTPGGVNVLLPVRLEAGVSAAFQLPSTGIYLVKVGNKTHKIVSK